MNTSELGIREQEDVQTSRQGSQQTNAAQLKLQKLAQKMVTASSRQPALQLRPSYHHGGQTKPERLTHAIVLQLAQTLRTKHIYFPYALQFQFKDLTIDKEVAQKMRLAMESMRRRQLNTRQYQHQWVEEKKFGQQHVFHPKF